jgi:uncharacterized membrane protein YhaH (DUF805 family)
MNYYLSAFKQYAVFSGRSRRSEYWYFVLFNVIFAIVAMFLDKLFGTTFSINTIGGTSRLPYGYFYLLYFLAVLIPSLAVAVRRLHDIGKSGWFFLICLIPVIGSIWLLVLMCIDSIPGPNQYGINPKGIGNYDEIDEVGSYLQK